MGVPYQIDYERIGNQPQRAGFSPFPYLTGPIQYNQASYTAINDVDLYTGNSYCGVFKSVDGGVTWTVQDRAHAPACSNISAQVSGTTIWFVYGVYIGPTQEMRIVSFDLTTNTYGTPITGGPIVESGPMPFTTNGTAFRVLYPGAGVNVSFVYYSGGWGVGQIIDTGISFYQPAQALRSAADESYFLYSSQAFGSPTHLTVKQLHVDSGGTVGTTTTLVTATGAGFVTFAAGLSYYNEANGTCIWACFLPQGSAATAIPAMPTAPTPIDAAPADGFVIIVPVASPSSFSLVGVTNIYWEPDHPGHQLDGISGATIAANATTLYFFLNIFSFQYGYQQVQYWTAPLDGSLWGPGTILWDSRDGLPVPSMGPIYEGGASSATVDDSGNIKIVISLFSNACAEQYYIQSFGMCRIQVLNPSMPQFYKRATAHGA